MTMHADKEQEKSINSRSRGYGYTQKDLENVATGACFLGSGGGGTLESAMNLVRNFKAGAYYPKDIVESENIEAVRDGYTISVAYIGAPAEINGTVLPEGPVKAAMQVKKRLEKEGKRLKYIVPVEAGALSVTVACLVAARLGIQVLDADGAGRSVPSLPVLPLSHSPGLSPSPAIVVNQNTGLCVAMDMEFLPDSGISDQNRLLNALDRILRGVISDSEFNQYGGFSLWLMEPDQLQKANLVRNTLWNAREIGEAINTVSGSAELITLLNEKKLIPHSGFGPGYVNHVWRLFGPGTLEVPGDDTHSGEGGFDKGKILVRAPNEVCTVLYQNESLAAYMGGEKTLANAPDSIAYFLEDATPGEQRVFSNGDLLTTDGKLLPQLQGKKFTLIGISGDRLLWDNQYIVKNFAALIKDLGYNGTLAQRHNGIIA